MLMVAIQNEVKSRECSCISSLLSVTLNTRLWNLMKKKMDNGYQVEESTQSY
jgi:hypothetical protein